jgi:SAM-dependent methyltransferase
MGLGGRRPSRAVFEQPPPGQFPELQRHFDTVYDLLAGDSRGKPWGPLLDAGSGDGSALAAVVSGTGAWGVATDVRASAEWAGPPGFQELQANADRLPFRDRAFTAALTMESIEWFANPAAVLRELARVSERRLVAVQTDWSSLWFDSGDPETAREFTRLFAGPSGAVGAQLTAIVAEAAIPGNVTHAPHTIRGERLTRGTYAFELLRLLRRWLIVQPAGVRARRFDDWRAELDERAERGAFSFSLDRHAVSVELPA